MSISTKKGDTGYTDLLGGERVPKFHPRAEAMGTLDETSSFLGLARAYSKNEGVKRILLEIQKHFSIIVAEISREEGRPLKKTLSETEVDWLDRLVQKYEAVLDIPPNFVTFGQEETSSRMDIARASVRKAERVVVKLNSEGMLENNYIPKYLNRLSDVLFLLACFEQEEENQKRKNNRMRFPFKLPDHLLRRWIIFMGSIILSLTAAIIYCSILHCRA